MALDLPLVAEIPADYVAEEGLRLQLYRRIAGITREEELAEMRQELLDRFGSADPKTPALPPELDNLFYQIRVKIGALQADVGKIGRRRDQLAIMPNSMEKSLPGKKRVELQMRLRAHLGRRREDNEKWEPNVGVHVGKEAIYLPIDDEGRWQDDLLQALVLITIERQTG